MSYLYVCMCGCTADTCLFVLYMLVVHVCCMCALLVCVINGKSECCLGGCFVLLHLLCIYECTVAMHVEERWRERWEEGSVVVVACELPQSARGGPSVGACCGDGSGVGARAAVRHRTKRASERDRDGKRAGDANATVHDKLKKDS
jgi:hypothetical protein